MVAFGGPRPFMPAWRIWCSSANGSVTPTGWSGRRREIYPRPKPRGIIPLPDALVLEAASSLDLADGLDLSLSYSGQIAMAGQSHGLSASIGGQF